MRIEHALGPEPNHRIPRQLTAHSLADGRCLLGPSSRLQMALPCWLVGWTSFSGVYTFCIAMQRALQ